VENPNEFVLLEAFQDDAAASHVNSDHFALAMTTMPQALVKTPEIISEQIDAAGWGLMGEITID
jgi:quinol monooxygenase YgiN